MTVPDKQRVTPHMALRLALHTAALDDLLAEGDHGDDLFDAGLLQPDAENDAYCNLTESGAEVIRAAIAAGEAP